MRKLLAFIFGLAIFVTACSSGNASLPQTDSSETGFYETSEITSSVCVTDDSSEITESTLPTKKPNPSEYADYLDIPMPKNVEIPIRTSEYNGKEVSDYCFTDSGWGPGCLGWDNPLLIEKIRTLTGDDSADSYTINYYSDNADYRQLFNFSSFEWWCVDQSECKLKLDIVRYILAANGLRMWIDEADYDLLHNSFGNAVDEIYKDKDAYESEVPGFAEYIESSRDFRHISECPFFDNMESNPKFVECYVIESLWYYNCIRESMIFGFYGGRITQIRNTDGRHVLVPTESQYEKLFSSFETAYGIRLDPLHDGPEDRQDLIDSGVEVEQIDKMMDILDMKKV